MVGRQSIPDSPPAWSTRSASVTFVGAASVPAEQPAEARANAQTSKPSRALANQAGKRQACIGGSLFAEHTSSTSSGTEAVRRRCSRASISGSSSLSLPRRPPRLPGTNGTLPPDGAAPAAERYTRKWTGGVVHCVEGVLLAPTCMSAAGEVRFLVVCTKYSTSCTTASIILEISIISFSASLFGSQFEVLVLTRSMSCP